MSQVSLLLLSHRWLTLRTLSYLSICNVEKWKESGGIVYKREPGLRKEGRDHPP